jgi:WD40 repeat protein
MGDGWYLDPKTEVFNSGTRIRNKLISCFRVTRIRVRPRVSVNSLGSTDSIISHLPVISIDLSKQGDLLASGSGDCQARIWRYDYV